MIKKNISAKISKYKFEFRHITVLLVILISFQIILSFIQKSSLQSFLEKTQKWYQQDSAERMANLSTTSLELLVGNMRSQIQRSEEEKQKIVQSFNIIFSQQLLEPNVEETCLIILKDNNPFVINEGIDFYNFLTDRKTVEKPNNNSSHALRLFQENLSTLKKSEEIFTVLDQDNTFHILVPFIPYGEFVGVFYMKNKPNFEFITKEVLTSYDEVALIYTSLIILGLMAMYYISSYTVKERDEARHLYYEEQEQHLKDTIDHEKESLFTKRIYHTHHKAEKVMGFIKEDLRLLNVENIEDIKNRVSKYANFVSRVIYDMKWYDPPVQTIRNQAFKTNVNSVIKFIVNHLFLRLSNKTDFFKFELKLDDRIPKVHINEFVIWEIIEPLIQNSIDHSTRESILVTIETKYNPETNKSLILISDTGTGIATELLEKDQKGIKKIFSENVSTKQVNQRKSGYGCYIAYQMATVRCGWLIDVENLDEGGCRFIIEF
ncbi:MAG: ATP-binding protein [Ignavibacteriales bacterium]|nr:ATP-binding protein [Ignavibacteriales bacterium]MCB9259952.1 ATP-binding protein [Ignavibacteriales bacterium]